MVATKECKVELSDHDHVIEAVAWSNEKCVQYINEATGSDVSVFCCSFFSFLLLSYQDVCSERMDGIVIMG